MLTIIRGSRPSRKHTDRATHLNSPAVETRLRPRPTSDVAKYKVDDDWEDEDDDLDEDDIDDDDDDDDGLPEPLNGRSFQPAINNSVKSFTNMERRSLGTLSLKSRQLVGRSVSSLCLLIFVYICLLVVTTLKLR